MSRTRSSAAERLSFVAALVVGPATFTITKKNRVPVDTTGGIATVVLPPAIVGAFARVKDWAGTALSNNITVQAVNSDTIEQVVGGNASTLVIATNKASVDLECQVAGFWSIV